MFDFDPKVWAAVPHPFWSGVFFILGSIVGSFLNVCIYRMPRGESIVSPPSHCPQCQYSIPWYLNIPLVTWLWLRARCAHCGKPIPARYVLVEFLTGCLFLAAWETAGETSAGLALCLSALLAGFVVATFIDLEHFIIPDEITIGGTVLGFVLSALVPSLHGVKSSAAGLQHSFVGLAVGGGLVYGIVRGGKLLFGRERHRFAEDTRVLFTETDLHLPEGAIGYEEIFYRKTDTVKFQASRLELVDRGYRDASVRLNPATLAIGDDKFPAEEVLHLEAWTREIVLPREAMGFGDVKFMAAIGAFLGWQSVVFSLMVASTVGALIGIALILAGKREWSSRLPFGPFIAFGATAWIFGGQNLWHRWML